MPCSAEFRDPTQPAYPIPSATTANTADSGNALVLSAIWISPRSKRAIINGVSARQGQTIVIEQTPALKAVQAPPANSTKDEPLNKATESTNAQTNHPTQENIISPLGNMVAPLLKAATGSMDAPQLQEQSTVPAKNSSQQPPAAQRAEALYIPGRSNTIKIIRIYKNSVIITHNGEPKTLHLVQRPYKTQ